VEPVETHTYFHTFRAPNGASLGGRTSTQILSVTVVLVVVLHQWRERAAHWSCECLCWLCWCIKADVAAAVDVAAQADSVLWNTPRSRSPALQFQLLSGQVALWPLSSVAVSVSVSVTVALAVFSVSSAFSVVVLCSCSSQSAAFTSELHSNKSYNLILIYYPIPPRIKTSAKKIAKAACPFDKISVRG